MTLSLTLYENVDMKRVSQAIKSNDISDESKKQLKAYSKKWDTKKNAFRVDYEYKGLHYGRRYATKSLSLQNFKGKLRETLVYDTHTDIDIKNCHPVLLKQYCEKQGIKHDALEDYVNNRDVRIGSIISAYGCTRGVAKDLIIRLLYLDSLSKAQLDLGFELTTEAPEWVIKFEAEMIKISKFLCTFEETIYSDVKKLKAHSYKNKEASTVSYTIQKIEDDIISNACIKLKQLGYNVDTLCFDGVLVHSQNIDDDILEEMANYCFETTSYLVEFAKKPMKCHYKLEDEVYDFTNFEFEHLDCFNSRYCMSLEGDTGSETYALRKAYFEKFFCMVESPTPIYIRHAHDEDKKAEPLSSTEMTQLLKPVKSGFPELMRSKFFSVWEEDCYRRQYRKMDFIPFNPARPSSNPNIFNLFEGYNPDCLGEPIEHSYRMKKIRPFLELAFEICGGEAENAEYFHRFIAEMLQNPAEKPPVAVCIKSKEGVGKNVLLDTIGRLVGSTHYITSSNPDDFFGTHAEAFRGKLLINLNEAEGNKTFDYEGRIKSFITEPTVVVNPKHQRPMEIKNFARIIVTTNKSTPIAIDVKGKDRRWVVFQSTEKTLTYSGKFWGQLVSFFKEPQFLQALYQYYTEDIDNSDFDWAKSRPITQAYRDMCDKFQPVEVLFLEDYIREERWKDKGIEGDKNHYVDIPTMDFFDDYEEYKRRHRFTREGIATNSRAFQGRLMELGLPISKVKSNTVMLYRFIPEVVYETMESRVMINSWKFDEADRIALLEKNVVDAPEDYFV